MRRATVLGRLAEPATRLIGVAIGVGALVVIQVIALVTGGLIATREADRALDDSFAYLADVSSERVVTFGLATEQVAGETARSLEFEDPGMQGVAEVLHGALTSRSQIDAVSVTYADGDHVELSRSHVYLGGFASYVINVGGSGYASYQFGEYDAKMDQKSREQSEMRWDPRESGCYERATRAASAVWSEPQVNPLTGHVQVWACEAARTSQGHVAAVVSVSMDLAELGRLLNVLPAGSDGEVFLLAIDRAVLAMPLGVRSVWWSQSTNTDVPPLAREIGVQTDAEATVATIDDVFGSDGTHVTLERGMGDSHFQWIVHLRATELGVNEGFQRLRTTVIAIIVGLVVLTAGIGYLMSRMWGPLMSVKDVAEKDPLTGLFNRHHVHARIGRTLAASRRSGQEVAVVMLDLDNFKALNDDLGHSAGDAALEDIGAVLVNDTRQSDLAVRWGGDEFLLVMRLPAVADAEGVVERIRSRAQAAVLTRFPGRSDLGVTAGFVVSEGWVGDVDSLIAAADSALVDGKWTRKGATYQAR